MLEDGEFQKNIGWGEAQSCTYSSAFFSQPHPIVSSQTSQLLSIALDRFTETWPSTSTVVIRHRLSGKPVLLYYPYGEGTIFLAPGFYSDWSAAHSQMSRTEEKILRDLMTFARAPKLPVKMIDYADYTSQAVDLDVSIKNISKNLPESLRRN